MTLKRESPEIAKAMRVAQIRTNQHMMEMAKSNCRMIVSEVQHLNNQEVARALKARLQQQGRGRPKELPEPPQRSQPWTKLGHNLVRPTQLPPMPDLKYAQNYFPLNLKYFLLF